MKHHSSIWNESAKANMQHLCSAIIMDQSIVVLILGIENEEKPTSTYGDQSPVTDWFPQCDVIITLLNSV